MSDPHRDMMPMHEAQHTFDVVLRGYDKHQVAETIERLEADFRIALADRDAAVGRSSDLASQLSAMHGEIEALRRKAATASAPTFENISERIQHMLQLAEEEAAEIRRAAETEAHAVREQTAAEERAMLERHAAGQTEVERMLAEARQSAEQIAQKAQARADELVQKAPGPRPGGGAEAGGRLPVPPLPPGARAGQQQGPVDPPTQVQPAVNPS